MDGPYVDSMTTKRVMVVAGEASGDSHGAALVRALSELEPSWTFVGMGGDQMMKAGVDCLYRLEDVSVVGFVEVAARLPALWRAWRGLRKEMRRRPDIIVLIDFPDFNFLLARYARKLDIPVIFYVSPQVWAWRKGRIDLIKRLVDRILVLFPFERDLYEEAGVPVTYVGHPLVDEIDLPGHDDVLARAEPPDVLRLLLLPGSRPSEVRRIMPSFLDGVERLVDERSVNVELVRAPSLPRHLIDRELAGRASADYIEIVSRDEVAWEEADLAWVASGTATLETALRGIPLIVGYRVSLISYVLGRALIEIAHISLVNLVADRRVVPELIQGDLNGASLIEATRPLVDDKSARSEMLSGLLEVRDRLVTDRSTARSAAEAVRDVVYGPTGVPA